MARVRIPREKLDEAPEFMGEYPVVPEGIAIPFQIVKSPESNEVGKQGTFKKDGAVKDSLIINCKCLKGDGEGIVHDEFFNMTDNTPMGLGKFCAFLKALEVYEDYGDDWDTNALLGLTFTADVTHYKDKRDRVQSSLTYKTISLDGATGESAEKPQKPKRSGARGGAAR